MPRHRPDRDTRPVTIIEVQNQPVRARTVTAALFGITVLQLAVATFVPGLEQFEGKGFAARLIAYPAMMLLVPAVWWLVSGRRRAATPGGTTRVAGRRNGRDGAEAGDGPETATVTTPQLRTVPWAAFAWIMLPFAIDVTGNTLNLYDSLWWWDDANHLVNWLFLSLGAGLLLARGAVRPRWALGLLVAGVGAILAIGWEIGEYYAFIRAGTELGTAYTDTLGDEVLGTLGAGIAGVLIATRHPAT